MTLRETLAKMYALRPLRYRILISELSERLKLSAHDGALKAGDLMPDFVLPDADGELAFSDDLLTSAPLVIVFFRGDWCPFCQTTLSALNQAFPEIEAAGATLVALTPDTGDHVRSARDGLGLRFPILSDVDGATALRFGLTYRVPDAMNDYWLETGIDISARHGDERRLLPLVATFVADGDGVLRFAYASGDITDRVDPTEILAQVKSAINKPWGPTEAAGKTR